MTAEQPQATAPEKRRPARNPYSEKWIERRIAYLKASRKLERLDVEIRRGILPRRARPSQC